ncbi:MAG: hypothetical protein EOO23_01755 [Comamonadaceae bacterium]|nr:MAG: hypothetical protein EOO23_01755 [Comamonadaceae bacterium]
MDPAEPITTGRELALRMNSAFPGLDWVAMLMKQSGCARDYVEWHLQEEMVPPEAVLLAAAKLLSEVNTGDSTEQG